MGGAEIGDSPVTPRKIGGTTRLSSKIHKWLALIIGVQMLFWFASGLFFAAVPIERVRSEHSIRELEPAPIALPLAAQGLARVAAAEAGGADKVELRSLIGRPVALITRGKARPRLYDLPSGRLLSPFDGAEATRIAAANYKGEGRPLRASLVTSESTEYRGALPAWRVDFDDGANRAFYVSADLGTVAARRSDLWRIYDFLWGLHIMDWKNHQDFNHPWLWSVTALGLIIIVTGFVLIPGRMGWTRAWRRRRPRDVDD